MYKVSVFYIDVSVFYIDVSVFYIDVSVFYINVYTCEYMYMHMSLIPWSSRYRDTCVLTVHMFEVPVFCINVSVFYIHVYTCEYTCICTYVWSLDVHVTETPVCFRFGVEGSYFLGTCVLYIYMHTCVYMYMLMNLIPWHSHCRDTCVLRV